MNTHCQHASLTPQVRPRDQGKQYPAQGCNDFPYIVKNRLLVRRLSLFKPTGYYQTAARLACPPPTSYNKPVAARLAHARDIYRAFIYCAFSPYGSTAKFRSKSCKQTAEIAFRPFFKLPMPVGLPGEFQAPHDANAAERWVLCGGINCGYQMPSARFERRVVHTGKVTRKA